VKRPIGCAERVTNAVREQTAGQNKHAAFLPQTNSWTRTSRPCLVLFKEYVAFEFREEPRQNGRLGRDMEISSCDPSGPHRRRRICDEIPGGFSHLLEGLHLNLAHPFTRYVEL
jgi:hypothetical protein